MQKGDTVKIKATGEVGVIVGTGTQYRVSTKTRGVVKVFPGSIAPFEGEVPETGKVSWRSKSAGNRTWQCKLCKDYYAHSIAFREHLRHHEREQGRTFSQEEWDALMPPLRKHEQREHTEACTKRYTAARARRDAWTEQWPLYCQTCNGAGETYDGRCLDCIVIALCPRCRKDVSENPPALRKVGCRSCGWKFDDMLPGARCTCEER